MPTFSRRTVLSGSSALLMLICSTSQVASANEPYPTKPIKLVIGFGAGGITDVSGRVVAQALSDELGQQVVIDNRPGAGGGIAAAAVAQAPADGYTLLLGTVGTQVVNKLIYKKLAYDPSALTPISLVSNSPYVLATTSGTNAKSLGELLSNAKANPGKLNFGSAGNGSSPHLCLELLKLTSNVNVAHVPFKSGAEAVNAAIAGQVDVVCDAITVISPQAKAGRLNIVALTADKRNQEIPEVPTGAEQGVAGLQVGSWNALLGPAKLPANKVETLNKALAKAYEKPALRKRLAEMGIDVLPLGAAAYANHLKAESDKWTKVVNAAGTKLD